MTRLAYPAGFYSSALPDTSRAIEYSDRIETSEQRVEFPGTDILALVSRRFNGFLYLSGQGHNDGLAWLWGPKGWASVGSTHGVSPCAFGTDSLFFSTTGESYRRVRLDTGEVSDHAMTIGSQGIRYVDGETVVTGDQTLFDGTVHEYTDRGDVRGGQGHSGGYLLNGRVLELGDCQFCRLERDGDQLAVAIVKFLEGQSVLHFLTRAEVDLLPLPVTPPPEPVQQPPVLTVHFYEPLLKAGVPWAVDFSNDGDGTRFVVSKDEHDQLWIEAENDAGSTATGLIRQLTVEGPDVTPEPEPEPEPPPMHIASRFWCHPNIGSKDLLDMFDDMSLLAQVDVFGLYVQEILTDVSNPQLGTNIWPNLVAHDVVRKLAQAGIPLAIELGAVKPGDCLAQGNISGMQTALQRVHDAGGVVGYLTMDEPLTANQQACGGNLDQCADAVSAFIHSAAAIDPDIKVGWIEAWPEVAYNTQSVFLEKLKARNALPTHWHLDIDWNRAAHEKKNPEAFIELCHTLADSYGIALGVQINSTVDPLPTDAAHYANLKMLAVKLQVFAPHAGHVITQSWCTRTGGTQDMPNNLGTSGLLASFAFTRSTFDTVTLPTPEPEIDPMLYKLMDPTTHGVIRVKSLKALDGGKFTAILPDDKVVSIQPDGSFETRDAGTTGEYEQCYAADGLLFYAPQGNLYSWAYRLLPA